MDLGDIGRRVVEANKLQRKIDFLRKQDAKLVPGLGNMIEALEAEKAAVLAGQVGLPGVPPASAQSAGKKGTS